MRFRKWFNEIKIVAPILGSLILGKLFIDALKGFRCPRCNYPVGREDEDCPNCNQPLDWSEKRAKKDLDRFAYVNKNKKLLDALAK